MSLAHHELESVFIIIIVISGNPFRALSQVIVVHPVTGCFMRLAWFRALEAAYRRTIAPVCSSQHREPT